MVLSKARRANERRRPGQQEILGLEALETPLPGKLLVLLSRLHRSEGQLASQAASQVASQAVEEDRVG